jgi:hypothetical protein
MGFCIVKVVDQELLGRLVDQVDLLLMYRNEQPQHCRMVPLKSLSASRSRSPTDLHEDVTSKATFISIIVSGLFAAMTLESIFRDFDLSESEGLCKISS